LNRLYQKSYSDGTPTAYFIYDTKPDWNVAQTNIIGRMTEAYTNQSELLASVFGYDSMGRVVLNNQVAGSASPAGGYSLEYIYDLLGDMTSATNGLGSVAFTYGYNSAAQLTGVTSSISDANHPSSLLSGVLYSPPGSLASAFMGTYTSTSGIYESRTYDKRLRPLVISTGVNTPTGFVGLVGMTYGYAPNGDVTSLADGPTGNWTFTYDDFNRLQSTVVPNYSTSPYAYVYDRYGNRWKQTANGTCTAGTAFCISFDANNHVTGGILTYDAAGNVIADNMHHYTYDAENRLTEVDAGTTASYLYDALGRRVQKTAAGATVNYLYDLDGHVVTELASTGEWTRGEVYAGSRHLVTYRNGLTYFSSVDALGSERVRSTQNESSVEGCDSLPFGDDQYCYGSAVGNVSPLHFTGQERDTETNLDNFEARYMASSLGRFMSPDSSDDPDPIPYADLGDPQSLNLYAYAENDPLSSIDPDGHDPCPASQGLATGAGCATTQAPDPALKPPLIDRILNVLFGGAGTVPPDPSTQHLGPPSPGPASGSKPRTPTPNLPTPNASHAAVAGLGLAGAAGEITCVVAEPCGAVELIGGLALITVGTAKLYQNLHFANSEQSRIKAAAKEVGVDQYALGTAIEAYKEANGIPNEATLGYKKIVEIAKQLKRGDWWSGVKKQRSQP
jgi:RHS repeat-associated protein